MHSHAIYYVVLCCVVLCCIADTGSSDENYIRHFIQDMTGLGYRWVHVTRFVKHSSIHNIQSRSFICYGMVVILLLSWLDIGANIPNLGEIHVCFFCPEPIILGTVPTFVAADFPVFHLFFVSQKWYFTTVHWFFPHSITLCACARGTVIGFVCCLMTTRSQ